MTGSCGHSLKQRALPIIKITAFAVPNILDLYSDCSIGFGTYDESGIPSAWSIKYPIPYVNVVRTINILYYRNRLELSRNPLQEYIYVYTMDRRTRAYKNRFRRLSWCHYWWYWLNNGDIYVGKKNSKGKRKWRWSQMHLQLRSVFHSFLQDRPFCFWIVLLYFFRSNEAPLY